MYRRLNVRKSLMTSEILLKEQTFPMGSRYAHPQDRNRVQTEISHISFRLPTEASVSTSVSKSSSNAVELTTTSQPSQTKSIGASGMATGLTVDEVDMSELPCKKGDEAA